MGIFRTKVKQGKTYSMAEAIKILSKEEYQGYTTQEIGNGKYKIITEEQPPKYGDWRANAKRYNPKELTR